MPMYDVRRLALEGVRSIRTYFSPISISDDHAAIVRHYAVFMVAAIQSRVVVIRVSRVTQLLVTATARR
jgi:hypothetical protein